MRSLRLHAPVRPLGGNTFKAPLVFPDAIAPLAHAMRHEAHGVLALCLQKALRLHALLALPKLGNRRRIAGGKFHHVILFYGHKSPLAVFS